MFASAEFQMMFGATVGAFLTWAFTTLMWFAAALIFREAWPTLAQVLGVLLCSMTAWVFAAIVCLISEIGEP